MILIYVYKYALEKISEKQKNSIVCHVFSTEICLLIKSKKVWLNLRTIAFFYVENKTIKLKHKKFAQEFFRSVSNSNNNHYQAFVLSKQQRNICYFLMGYILYNDQDASKICEYLQHLLVFLRIASCYF